MDDAALVATARTGDRDAWGLIFDRYADGLHDHCWSILRDEQEAGDALQDAFVTAAGGLGGLRDGARLRPWLDAIARDEACRRCRARTGAGPTPGLGDGELGTVTIEGDERSGAPVDDLRRLVWEAVGGLPADDQALLDLHLRHALDGQDLAEAMGIAPAVAAAALARLRDTLERSLGALVVARTGTRDCPELAALLAAEDATMSPVLQAQVARHIDGCETCGQRKRTMVSPLTLLAGVPLVPAPATRRERILDRAVAVSAAAPVPAPALVPSGGRGGGSPPTTATPALAATDRGERRRGPWPWVAAVAALVAIAALAFGLSAGTGGDDAASGVTTPSAESTTTSAPTTSSTSSTTSTSSTSTTSTTLSLLPGAIVLRGGAIDLGTSGTAASFSIQNTGGTAVSYVLTTSSALVRAVPVAGTVDPGQTRSITIRFERGDAAEGPFVHQVTIDAGSAGQAVGTISGSVPPRPPVLGDIESSEPDFHAACDPANDRTTITANFADESAVASADLRWESSANGPGSRLMEVGSGTAIAELGPFAAADTITYRVVVTDVFGASATSLPETIDVLACAD